MADFVHVHARHSEDTYSFLSAGKVVSEVMSAITSSQKSFIAFYTSDSSLPSGPQMEVFEYKRQAGDILDESPTSSSPGTVCALLRVNSTTVNGGRCSMMCLTTPIYRVNLTESGSVHQVLGQADTIESIKG